MQCLDEEAFEHFKKLYDCVNEFFEKMRRKAEQKLRHPVTSIRWHFFLAVLVVFLSWFFGPGSFIMTPIRELLQMNGVLVDGMFFFFLLMFGFAGWIIAIVLISRPVFRYTTSGSDDASTESSADNPAGATVSRCPTSGPDAAAKSSADRMTCNPVCRWIRLGFLLAYSVVILPALPFLLILGPLLASGASIRPVLVSYALYATLSLVAWLLMFGLLTMVSGGVPQILFMLLSSVSRGEKGALVPRYIDMVQDTACQVTQDGKLNKLTVYDWRCVETIARWKFDGVNGRVQVFSLGVGALGLFGILALLFSQEEIRSSLRQFANWFMTIVGIGVVEYDVSAVLVLGIVGIVFFLAARYFARSYIELRILEAMGIICSLAASGSANQQHSGQTQTVGLSSSPKPSDTAPSSSSLPAAAVVPVASAASGSDSSNAAQSSGDSSSAVAAPMPSAAPGSELSGSAASPGSMAGEFATLASGTPDAAQ
ncbi:MAG: hypothetical protein RMJ48_16215 [Roseiflexaceae bacterium]|nr:hypothetical protein [Roseiflexaceae bacterium]